MRQNLKIDWVDVTSSNVAKVAHDPDTEVFMVQFTNGGLYSYDGVGHDIFETIQTVPSVGRYFNMMVKAYHDHKKWSSEAELVNYLAQKSA